MRDLQRKGSEDGRSSPKSSDYKIAQIVVDREIPEQVLSGFQRAKAGKEDVEEKFQALFNVWKIIHMKATTNEGQPVPSVGQEMPILIPDTDERDVTESEPCINPTHPLDERNALEDQALLDATQEDRVEMENHAVLQLISSDMGLDDKENDRMSKPDEPVPSTSEVQPVLTSPSVQKVIQVSRRRYNPPAFENHLYWPEQPKSQGKRKRQKLPHAISSETWRAHYQEKDEEH